jgi:hypothetical protein
VAKHLIDTDLYIDLIQSGTTLPFIRGWPLTRCDFTHFDVADFREVIPEAF